MLARRLRRDLVERGRDAEGVLDQYLRYVKPSFDNFVQVGSLKSLLVLNQTSYDPHSFTSQRPNSRT